MQEEGLFGYIKKVKNREIRFENAHERLSRMVGEDWPKYRKSEYADFMNNIWANFSMRVRDCPWLVVTDPGHNACGPIDYLCDQYAEFSAKPENRRFTFRFVDLEFSDHYRDMQFIQSETFEDPMLLALNFFDDWDSNKDFLKTISVLRMKKFLSAQEIPAAECAQ